MESANAPLGIANFKNFQDDIDSDQPQTISETTSSASEDDYDSEYWTIQTYEDWQKEMDENLLRAWIILSFATLS